LRAKQEAENVDFIGSRDDREKHIKNLDNKGVAASSKGGPASTSHERVV
jgi:hypothetical protein